MALALAPRFRRVERASPRSPWAWTAAGVVLGLLLCALFFAPARWLKGWVQQASAGHLLLEDARGTLWTGSARLTLRGGAGSVDAATLPGRLSWRLRPSFSGDGPGLALELGATCCLQQAWVWQFLPHLNGIKMVASDSLSQWPAQWLTGLGTPWNTIAAQGQLSVSTQALVLNWAAGRLQISGGAQVDALDLSSRLSTLRPMGSYRFSLGGGATPELQLTTLSGSLQLSGRGQWVGNKLRFTGEARAAPDSLAALSNLLNIIGRRDGARSIIQVG